MCTIIANKQPINNKNLVGYKIVIQGKHLWNYAPEDMQSPFYSYYQVSFRWKLGKNIAIANPENNPEGLLKLVPNPISPSIYAYSLTNGFFHCFKNLCDAQELQYRLNFRYAQYRLNFRYTKVDIIKLLLRGDIYEGLSSHMQAPFNNLLCYCSTIAYWNGKTI